MSTSTVVSEYKDINPANVDRILRKYGNRDEHNFGETEIIYPGKPSKTKLSLTSKYGMGEFPLHTDVAYWPVPARYVALYCINPGRGNRTTKIVDLKECLDEFIDAVGFENDLFMIRQRSKPFYAKIVNGNIGERWIRWDPEIMTPLVDNNILKRVSGFILAKQFLEIEWQRNMLVVINNLTSLHGRGNSSISDEDRILRRILIR